MKKIICLLLCAISIIGLASCAEQPKLKIIDIKLTEEEYAFIIQEGNSALKESFDEYLDSIKANGEFDAIVDKYINNKEGKVGVVAAVEAPTNTEGLFVVATNVPFGPFEYRDIDGKVYGIDIEIAQGYAKSKGLELAVVTMDFDAIFPSVAAGYSDIGMAGITVTPDRELSFDFTNTYYNASQKLIVLESNTDFDNCKTAADVEEVLKGLQGKKIGYQTATMGNWYIDGDEDFGFEGFANIEGIGNASLQFVTLDVLNGNLYAVVTDELPAQSLVESANK